MLNYRKFKTSLIHLTLFLSTSLSLTLPRKVEAQVVINGYLVQGQELAALEYQTGTKFPPGNYQIDLNTGMMVYQGSMGYMEGNIYTGQYVGQGLNGYEQGNIYQNHPQTGNSQGNVRSYGSTGGAGGWGHYASDGQCSYVSIVTKNLVKYNIG